MSKPVPSEAWILVGSEAVHITEIEPYTWGGRKNHLRGQRPNGMGAQFPFFRARTGDRGYFTSEEAALRMAIKLNVQREERILQELAKQKAINNKLYDRLEAICQVQKAS